MFLKITVFFIGLAVFVWLVRRIWQLRSRRKGWLGFQLAAEALEAERLPEFAGEFREFVRNVLRIDPATMNFAEQVQFLYEHLEELQSTEAGKYFSQPALAAHPEQTPWLGMAAYLGELVKTCHPNARWTGGVGNPKEITIEYPDDPPYMPYTPFADVYQAAYQHNYAAGPATLGFEFRHVLRADAYNRKRALRYTPEEAELFQKRAAEQFGPVTTVWHEIISPDVHLDVLEVRPPDSNVVHLITCGMGGCMMPLPEDKRASGMMDRLELMVTLPKDWPLSFFEQKRDRNYWPVQMLKDIARYPVETGQVLGPGHTVQMPQPYADTRFQSVLLLPPLGKTPEELRYRLSPEAEIGVLQLIPLYPEEREYIVKHEEKCSGRFMEATRIINPVRECVAPPEPEDRNP